MDCKEVNKELIFYIENSLSIKKSKAIENHIKTCKNCNTLYITLKESIEIIENEKIKETDSFFYKRLSEKFKKIDKPKEKQIWLKSKQVYLQSIAATIAIILSIYSGILLGSYQTNTNDISAEYSEVDEYELVAESYNLNQTASNYDISLLIEDEK